MSARRLEFLHAGYRRLVPEYYAYFGAPIVSFDFYQYRRDRRRDHSNNVPPTECLAPEGFCPGDRNSEWGGGYKEIRPGSQSRDYTADQVWSGKAEIVGPADEPRYSGGGVTECLAPDGFCP